MTQENRETFFARLEPMLGEREVALVEGAYLFAKFGHRSQMRKEKEPDGRQRRYFEHCRATALILIDELGIYDHRLICTGLLHDCFEDTRNVTPRLIEAFFEPQVCRWVKQVSKIPKAGYFERLHHADEEALIVKWCDRLHNLRTMPLDDCTFAGRKVEETLTRMPPIPKMLLVGVWKELHRLDRAYGSRAAYQDNKLKLSKEANAKMREIHEYLWRNHLVKEP
jgi:(p)ppGpp synthase/HD superfamily hydrolase